MNTKIHRKTTQLSNSDSFLIQHKIKDNFDFPLHFHPEYELNFIHKGKGLKRIIGDHIKEITNYELVLTGPNLPHCWKLHNCTNKNIEELTIHIHQDLLDEKLLSRSVFNSVRNLLNKSVYGISFSEDTIKEIMPRLYDLSNTKGINYFLKFISILHDLSISDNQKLLSTSSSSYSSYENSEKTKKIHDYVQNNFQRKISLEEISNLINMTPVSFNRFIKKSTGKTFVSFVNNIRISHATKLLLQSDLSVGEIAYKCGFNNLANFNRMFKKLKNNTPSEFKYEFNTIRKAI